MKKLHSRSAMQWIPGHRLHWESTLLKSLNIKLVCVYTACLTTRKETKIEASKMRVRPFWFQNSSPKEHKPSLNLVIWKRLLLNSRLRVATCSSSSSGQARRLDSGLLRGQWRQISRFGTSFAIKRSDIRPLASLGSFRKGQETIQQGRNHKCSIS